MKFIQSLCSINLKYLLRKIVIISTTQPSTNPRLVKEANTLSESGHEVIVLYCYVADWAQALDNDILQNVKWTYKQIGGKDRDSFTYKVSRYLYAGYKFLNKNLGIFFFSEHAHARCYKALLKEAVKIPADFYIGHNPGAMAIAANAALANNTKCGFDFEDYHRGEFLEANSIEVKRQIFIEKKYIGKFNYLSAASPLIKEKIETNFPLLNIPFITLLNSFSLKEQVAFTKANRNDDTLNLFWFSQHVGQNRGLQIVCEALKEINDPNIHLTLVGNYTNDVKNYFIKIMSGLEGNIHLVGLIPPSNLIHFSSTFDIGLAVEPGFSENNNLALSNKIFTYLLAGNAIIFSETIMQKNFNEAYKVGVSFRLNDKLALVECIKFYKDKNNLLKQRQHNYYLAQESLHWEIEAKKLLAIIG